MMIMWKRIIPFAVAIGLLFGTSAFGGSIRNTRHNLSVSGPGDIRALNETRICIFCHTPHNARRDIPYLWNRRDTTANYTTYRSSTLYSTVGQPTGASKLCLSCHDGTIALGAVISRQQEIPFRGGIRFMPQGRRSRLGTDLSDDHPVSFVYDLRLVSEKGELADPDALPPEVRLDRDDQLQCTTCHDPHDDTFDKFLVMSSQFSELCTACHRKEGWDASIHAQSNARLPDRGPDHWSGSGKATVAENGCHNCHTPHMAGGAQRLMNYAFEEDNCLVCHNATHDAPDIESALVKRSRHSVQDYAGRHDPDEDFASDQVPKHVECADCHNPHRANGDLSPSASTVSGANSGVTGIDAGRQHVEDAQYLYEICYKCHGDNNVIDRPAVTREWGERSIQARFDPANLSFHPVEMKGASQDVPSLISPYNTDSIITCIDCHGTDSLSGAKGPHGSIYSHLLERNYEIRDNTAESAFAYALCYKCHSRNSVLNNEGFSQHRGHVVDRRASCAVCHDPHGSRNRTRLINFALTSVRPDSRGRLDMVINANGVQCFLTCHGKEHGVP